MEVRGEKEFWKEVNGVNCPWNDFDKQQTLGDDDNAVEEKAIWISNKDVIGDLQGTSFDEAVGSEGWVLVLWRKCVGRKWLYCFLKPSDLSQVVVSSCCWYETVSVPWSTVALTITLPSRVPQTLFPCITCRLKYFQQSLPDSLKGPWRCSFKGILLSAICICMNRRKCENSYSVC